MKKPKKPIDIKLSNEDVAKAIQLYINDGSFCNDIECLKVTKCRSDGFFLTARIK